MTLGLGMPSAYRHDPYGFLTHQSAHILAGLVGAWMVLDLAGC
jgi:hypothetical protein